MGGSGTYEKLCQEVNWEQARRELGLDAGKSPAIPGVIDATVSTYGAVADFPFNEIVRDIQAFSHRRKRSHE